MARWFKRGLRERGHRRPRPPLLGLRLGGGHPISLGKGDTSLFESLDWTGRKLTLPAFFLLFLKCVMRVTENRGIRGDTPNHRGAPRFAGSGNHCGCPAETGDADGIGILFPSRAHLAGPLAPLFFCPARRKRGGDTPLFNVRSGR